MKLENTNLNEAEVWNDDSGVFLPDGTISDEELLEGDIYDEKSHGETSNQ